MGFIVFRTFEINLSYLISNILRRNNTFLIGLYEELREKCVYSRNKTHLFTRVGLNTCENGKLASDRHCSCEQKKKMELANECSDKGRQATQKYIEDLTLVLLNY